MDDPGALPAVAPPTIEEVEGIADYEVQLESLNQWQIAWRKFRRHRLAVIGSILFLGMVAIAVFGPLILPYDFLKIPRPDQLVFAGRPPSWVSGDWTPFLVMGETARFQRDVFTLVINGARLSLVIGIGATTISVIIGALWGGIAGYFGGWLDSVMMRIVDALLTVPILFIILVGSRFLGQGNWVTILLIFGLLGWLGISRLVRSLFLSLREEQFVDAARAVGVSDRRIILRHILPNALSPIIVSATLGVAAVIVNEAFVSYLGFGVDVNTPTWGNILSNSLEFVNQGNWWWTFFPGLAIVLTVLGINFMGDGLRDALDPRSRA